MTKFDEKNEAGTQISFYCIVLWFFSEGKLITVMISNFPKEQTQYKLDAFLKSKGIVCWGCRANFSAQ